MRGGAGAFLAAGMAAALWSFSCRPAQAQDDKSVMRALTQPGRIDGRLAGRNRNGTAAQPGAQPDGRGRGQPGLLAALAAAALMVPIGIILYRKRKAGATQPEPGERAAPASAMTLPQAQDESELLAGVADEAKRDAVAAHYHGAGRAQEFIKRNANRSTEFYEAYSRAFLKLGAWDAALALVQSKPVAEPGDHEFCKVLMCALANRNPELLTSAQAYLERLNTAVELSERGYPGEALSLLTDDVLLAAMKDAGESLQVAGIFQAAQMAADFTAKRAAQRPAQFYQAYASAFYALKNPAAALALIKLKQPMEAGDTALAEACLKALGGSGQPGGTNA